MMASIPENNNALLKTVSLSELLAGNQTASNDLFAACKDVGVFYLDARVDETEQMTNRLTQLYSFAKDLFAAPDEIKSRHDFNKIGRNKTSGYKRLGTETGAIEGMQDGFELYMVPQSELLSPDIAGNIDCPELVMSEKNLLAEWMEHCRRMGEVILTRLSAKLDPNDNRTLMEAHSLGSLSRTTLSFLRYPAYTRTKPNIGHVAHTDAGSLTILHSRLGGLQVLEPKTRDWVFVEPRLGHYVVNIGDSLRFLSHGILQSCLHRVMPHAETEGTTRFSIGYFMRPIEESEFVADDGKVWLSKDWQSRKFEAFAATHEEQSNDWVLGGQLRREKLSTGI